VARLFFGCFLNNNNFLTRPTATQLEMVDMLPRTRKKNGSKLSTKLLEGGSSPLEMTIDYKVGILRKLLDRTSSDSVKEFGLSLSDWRILTHIQAAESVTASELCTRLLIDKAEASRVISSLIERKLILRKTNPKNMRSVLLSLSKKGQDVFEKVLPVRIAFNSELASFLSKEQNAVLLNILDKLISNVVQKLTDDADKA
jgi:DNA-binding MarR family transcriptional regulator